MTQTNTEYRIQNTTYKYNNVGTKANQLIEIVNEFCD